MNALVLYASKTGNTRKVAQAIAEEVGAKLVEAGKNQLPDLAAVGFLFVGDGVYAGRPSRVVAEQLRDLPALHGKRAAVFGTYGAQAKQLEVLSDLLEAKGARVVDRFACPGKDWLVLGLLKRKHPDEEDLAQARRFAREAMSGA